MQAMEKMMWADFYKRWCELCCWWLPKTNTEPESGEETSQPETAPDRGPGNTETAGDEAGPTLRAAGTDDLTVIKGIGPALKTKLANLGIVSLADLAASDPEELATKLNGSSANRVKGWIDAAQDRIAKS